MKKQAMLAVLAAGAILVTGCSSSVTSTTSSSTEAKTEAKTETEESVTESALEESTEVTTQAVEEGTDESGESVAESTGLEDASVEEDTEEETEEETELGPRADYNALDYVTVGEYTGLPVEVEEIVITDEQIDEAVQSAIESAGAYDVLEEGTVQEGDIANIDYEGKKDDVAFDGGTATGYDLTIGSGTFIDGFEDGLIGVEIGSTVDLNLTFPENYSNEDLAGADVVFTVTVNSVQRMPEVTDDLISTITDGEYTTVEDYREYQRQQLTESAESSQKSTVQDELMTQLYNTCTVNAYPEEVVDYETARANNYYETYASYYGMTLEDFISTYFGMDLDTFNEYLDSSIRASLDQELVLCAIFETEEMEITDEIYEEYCEKYAQQAGFESADAFKEYYDENLIRASIKSEMAMDFVYTNAIITIAQTEDVTEAAEEIEAVSEAAEEIETVTEAVTE